MNRMALAASFFLPVHSENARPSAYVFGEECLSLPYDAKLGR